MSDGEAKMEAALRPFGWTCGPEFWKRYYSDAWVFNLANAVERLTEALRRIDSLEVSDRSYEGPRPGYNAFTVAQNIAREALGGVPAAAPAACTLDACVLTGPHETHYDGDTAWTYTGGEQEVLLTDDLLRCMEVRNLALEEAALTIQTGPDGQDYLDRSRMIRGWLEAAYERHGEGERAHQLTDGPAVPAAAPERAPSDIGPEFVGAMFAAGSEATRAPEAGAGLDTRPDPAACPTCGSTDRRRMERECSPGDADAWHSVEEGKE